MIAASKTLRVKKQR